MKRPQLIAILSSITFIAVLYYFGKTTFTTNKTVSNLQVSEINIDTILSHAKIELKPEQVTWLGNLEKSITRGDVKSQQLDIYHQLAHFWKDSAKIFEPFAWYEAQAARLEYSEKSLTFAAHLFLDNLKDDNNLQLKKWKALQAKDLFEKSLAINPKNDSSKVGLGACYIFGAISETPMEGILKVKEVADKDSTNLYAQMVLGQGSVISGQYDKAIDRFERVIRLQPANIEAILMLAEVYERKNNRLSALYWYQKAVPLIQNPEVMNELKNRIKDLSK